MDVAVVVTAKSGDKNAEAKVKVLRVQTICVHRKGNYFQRCWNEHDKWKVVNSYGHTTAGIRHGDTRVRAFT